MAGVALGPLCPAPPKVCQDGRGRSSMACHWMLRIARLVLAAPRAGATGEADIWLALMEPLLGGRLHQATDPASLPARGIASHHGPGTARVALRPNPVVTGRRTLSVGAVHRLDDGTDGNERGRLVHAYDRSESTNTRFFWLAGSVLAA